MPRRSGRLRGRPPAPLAGRRARLRSACAAPAGRPRSCAAARPPPNSTVMTSNSPYSGFWPGAQVDHLAQPVIQLREEHLVAHRKVLLRLVDRPASRAPRAARTPRGERARQPAAWASSRVVSGRSASSRRVRKELDIGRGKGKALPVLRRLGLPLNHAGLLLLARPQIRNQAISISACRDKTTNASGFLL